MKKVKVLHSNWRQVGSVSDRDGAGEDYDRWNVGNNGLISIEENEPTSQNEFWNYILKFEDGSSKRIFNPNYVEYEN